MSAIKNVTRNGHIINGRPSVINTTRRVKKVKGDSYATLSCSSTFRDKTERKRGKLFLVLAIQYAVLKTGCRALVN